MSKMILGKKLGMTQIFAQDGTLIPVTVIEAGPCIVVRVKSKETDGYDAVVTGFGDIRERLVSKPVRGQFFKTKLPVKRYIKEISFEGSESFRPGHVIKADVFQSGDKVDVSGLTKGKGFAGTIKRWNTHRGPESHGSGYHRGVGSMGGHTSPGRVFKTKKLPGRLGAERVTIQNLEVVKVDTGHNLILVKGAVPGPKGALLKIKSSVKGKK
jgi:large subunit ribosomal protein L3